MVYLLLLRDAFACFDQGDDGICEDWNPRNPTNVTSKLHSDLCKRGSDVHTAKQGTSIEKGAPCACHQPVRLSTTGVNETAAIMEHSRPRGRGSAKASGWISPAAIRHIG